MTRTSSAKALTSLAFLCCSIIAGCQSPEKNSGTSPSADLNARSEISGRSLLQTEEINWSPTLYYGGMRFRFQLPMGEEKAKPVFGHSDRKDFIEVNDSRVYRDRNRFKIGSSFYRWDTDSIIWVHSPPTADQPFSRKQGNLILTCFGDDSDPVIEEQKPDGSFTWTYKNARVALSSSNRLVYTYRGCENLLPGGSHLILGPQGELLEKRSP